MGYIAASQRAASSCPSPAVDGRMNEIVNAKAVNMSEDLQQAPSCVHSFVS